MQLLYKDYKKILCIRLDTMGDVIMTTPALRALKETFPQSNLTILTSSNGSRITPYISFLDKTIVYDAPWVKNKSKRKFGDIVNEIKRNSFDCAIIFTNFSQNPLPAALLAFLANIPERISYCRENPYNLLTTWIPDTEPFSKIKHGVQRQVDLVAAIGATAKNTYLHLDLHAESKKSLLRKLSKTKIQTTKPIIVVHPGASEKKRQFPIAFFAKVSRSLLKIGFEVIVTGTREEKSLLLFINRYCSHQTISLSSLSIGELIALINISSVLISNNTGPVHIASAMHTPVIVLYAATNPEHTPWKVPHEVFYFPVDKIFQSKNQLLQYIPPFPIKDFDVGDVIQAVKSLLSNSNKDSFVKQNKFLT